jgi:hypothetical protein
MEERVLGVKYSLEMLLPHKVSPTTNQKKRDRDSIPELNNKKFGNSPRFLTNTHATLSAKQFRSYGILMIEVAAEFCFWTEQRLS